ncbi:MAG TPA: aminotransferase, partial [Maritimibacter sp.]|nr:aminotransferase [Maritimibacter sp.]
TFAAVPSSVVHADCKPVLVDVMDNYRIDMADFERKLTDEIGAVIISHMRGHTSDMDAIMALCDAKGIPVVEDAAHSLGTLWHGKKIGTIGKIGCFSFQSYKMLNAGEGGVLISDDPDIIARAVIMSGAYEHNWKKHKTPDGQNSTELADAFARWQNKLPLYNQRLSNLSAAVIRPQIPELERRVTDGLRNHDYVAAKLNTSPWIDVPAPLGPETRAPDSIQFNLVNMSDEDTRAFMDAAKARGVSVQVFGMHTDNARAHWNWEFIEDQGALPGTDKMLMRACDTRLPVRLKEPELDFIAEALIAAALDVKRRASVAAE